IYMDDKKIGSVNINSSNGEWLTVHFTVEIENKNYVKITLELDDFITLESRGWTYDFGCVVNEISILHENSSLLRKASILPSSKESVIQKEEHLVYSLSITDYQYEMDLLGKSEKIDGRSFFYLRVRIKNTSKCLWLMFNHDTTSFVAVGVRLFDKNNKDYPQKMGHFKLGKNIYPGEEDIMTLQMSPLLKEGPHKLRIDMVEEFVCWFEEKGAKPLEIEVDL
ncbi:hypothetical protein KKB18_10235, partial [bacterium]|nr:hypothetical protein [bacterium]